MDKYALDPKTCDWGYYDFDNGRLYFNFVEMQTRRFYQNHAESWDSKMREEQELLSYLISKKSGVYEVTPENGTPIKTPKPLVP